MTKPINTDSIAKGTAKSWGQWVDELDELGARGLSHADLAKTVEKLLGDTESAAWWAQGITVAYEQHIGKRIPGQLANGLFELAVSKTVARPRDEVFPAVVSWFEDKAELRQHEPQKPRTSETSKRSTWRCDFTDGSKFSATVEDTGEKAKLVLSHTAVPTKEDADAWKVYWKDVADTIVDISEK